MPEVAQLSEFGGNGRQDIPKSRITILGGIISSVVLIYVVYLFAMQIIDGYVYSVRAEQVTTRSIIVPAQRGEVYDRNLDIPLASNIDSFAVDIIPAEIPAVQLERVLRETAGYLGMTVVALKEKISPESYQRYQPVELKSGLSFDTIAPIAEHLNELPGVTWRNKPIRNYLDGSTFAHVVGYVGEITPEELQILYNQGYTTNSIIGKSGIEYQYDNYLRGKNGRDFRTVDAHGRRMTQVSTSDVLPTPGNNLILTLDRRIQHLSQDALGNRSGAIVVLKPSTGEILAMVSYPTYDPNGFYAPGGSDKYAQLVSDPASPFLNRAIQGGASPASTFKVVMSTAVVEENAFPVDATVNCPGYFRLGNQVFRCWVSYGHGPVDLFDALAQSCDVYFYTVGSEYLGVDTIVDYSHRYGYGERTGIDLPGEIPGLVPSPSWKERVLNERWVGGDTVNMSIGQGALIVTPIQMANMMAMVVNDGIVYKPHILKEIRDHSTGEIVKEIHPEVLRTSAIRPQSFETVKEGLRGVITHGTAEYVITTDAVQVAGKTGTGEVGSDTNWNSWFVAYAPYDSKNPDDQIVVAVWVDAKNAWEWWAPKAANAVIHGIFKNLSYTDAVADLRRKGWWY